MDNTRNNIEEREIVIMDMFWATCERWRLILLLTVVFALILGAVGYVKGRSSNAESNAIQAEDMELSEESQRKADDYLTYKQLYLNQRDYTEKGPFMQLDPNGLYRGIIIYYVDNHYEVEYPTIEKNDNTDAIVQTYESRLKTDEFDKALRKVFGVDEDSVFYASDMVAVSDRAGTMTVTVYGSDEETCKELGDVVKTVIESAISQVSAKFGKHDVVLTGESYAYVSDTSILDIQQQKVRRLWEFENDLAGRREKLSEDERAYVNAMEGTGTVQVSSGKSSIFTGNKWKLIVAVGSVFLAFVLVACLYLLNNRLRLEDDFESIFGELLLGNIILKSDKKKKWFWFVDNFFNKMRHFNKRYFEEEDGISMVAAGVKIGAGKQQASRVYVTGACIGDADAALVDRIKALLGKTSDVELIAGQSILYNAEALEKAAEIGTVVLLEKAGVSLYSEIAEEIEVCRYHGMKVLGAVIVSD